MIRRLRLNSMAQAQSQLLAATEAVQQIRQKRGALEEAAMAFEGSAAVGSACEALSEPLHDWQTAAVDVTEALTELRQGLKCAGMHMALDHVCAHHDVSLFAVCVTDFRFATCMHAVAVTDARCPINGRVQHPELSDGIVGMHPGSSSGFVVALCLHTFREPPGPNFATGRESPLPSHLVQLPLKCYNSACLRCISTSARAPSPRCLLMPTAATFPDRTVAARTVLLVLPVLPRTLTSLRRTQQTVHVQAWMWVSSW